MANINQQWRRFMAVGCSHGKRADPSALAAVLKFADAWNPHERIHLGDFIDTETWRHGAKGTPDERESVEEDFQAGFDFIRSMRPNKVTLGNHDIRPYEHLRHTDAKLQFAAKWAVAGIRKTLKECRAQYIESYDMREPVWFTLGQTKFLHGFMFSASAVRDHAAQFGNCVIAHLHIVAAVPAASVLSPVGHCVGYLGDVKKFDYANRNRSTSQWVNGFAWGEYTDKQCMVWLARRNPIGPWRLPL